jgi:hypothetical protein
MGNSSVWYPDRRGNLATPFIRWDGVHIDYRTRQEKAAAQCNLKPGIPPGDQQNTLSSKVPETTGLDCEKNTIVSRKSNYLRHCEPMFAAG